MPGRQGVHPKLQVAGAGQLADDGVVAVEVVVWKSSGVFDQVTKARLTAATAIGTSMTFVA